MFKIFTFSTIFIKKFLANLYDSLCELFYISSSIFNKRLTPKQYFIYQFLNKRISFINSFDLYIIKKSNESYENSMQYIKGNYSLFKNIDESTLSLITYSLIFATENDTIKCIWIN